MERFQELREIAKKKVFVADHILTQTYPLLKDSKLLLATLENLFLAYANSIGSILHYELIFNRVPSFKEDFDSKFKLFKERTAPKYNIKQEDINTIKEIRDIIVQHKKSPIEFVRDDRFIICNDNYKMETINLDKLKKMMFSAKRFIDKVCTITSLNEGIFK
jgi:phage regulator Rha-like protein